MCPAPSFHPPVEVAVELQSPSPVFHSSHKCRVDLVPCDPPIESHHPAEQFSSALLQRFGAITRDDCLHLFDLLPSSQLRTGVDLSGAKFLCGSFRRGGIHGVLRATREFPLSTAALVAFVRSARPDFQFSSIAVHRDVPTSCHRDTNNFTDQNLVCPLSNFSGGSIWVQESCAPMPARRLLVCFIPWPQGLSQSQLASACILLSRGLAPVLS